MMTMCGHIDASWLMPAGRFFLACFLRLPSFFTTKENIQKHRSENEALLQVFAPATH
jgi:hypothetical protein